MLIFKVRTVLDFGELLLTLSIAGGKYGSALQAASERGYSEIIELLRAHGATR
jgi:hypothetical protein